MFRLSENQRFYFTIGLLSAVAVVLVDRGCAPFARSVPVWVYHVDPTAVTLKRHSRESVARTVASALQLPYEKVWDAYCRIDSR